MRAKGPRKLQLKKSISSNEGQEKVRRALSRRRGSRATPLRDGREGGSPSARSHAKKPERIEVEVQNTGVLKAPA